jgi:hypothetical protein
VIHFLCVTNRPNWRPWLMSQWKKLDVYGNKLTIVEPEPGESLGAARNRALKLSDPNMRYVGFMDDDDWQSQNRGTSMRLNAWRPDVLGAREGLKVDVATGRSQLHRTVDLVVFNGAIIHRDLALACRFPYVNQAEDTAWMNQVAMSVATYTVVVPSPLSHWLCHGQNATNRASQLSFDGGRPSSITDKELELARACAEGRGRWPTT